MAKKQRNPKPPGKKNRPAPPPAPPPTQQARRGFQGNLAVYRMEFLGKEHEISLRPENVNIFAILAALANMENEKVDSILNDFGIALHASGQKIWPLPKPSGKGNGKDKG